MNNHFSIEIPCKKYVKAYLEINCGTPVNLQHLPAVMEEFRRALCRKPEHRESAPVAEYKDKVKVIVPSDMFYRYGWEMNRENELDFNRKVEQQAKYFMRQYVSVNSSIGVPVAICIREFQEKFGFHEPIWSYESIKKDFDRHGKVPEMKTLRDLRAEINKILLDNLSELGTVSKKLKKEYADG